jgi:RNA 3'-phosphate cyclase
VKAMLDVDGSMMEGGGQLLRMATTYSAILGKPVRVHEIRASRNPPGLQRQHLVTLRAAGELCDAIIHPKSIKGGEYDIDIGTAGSIGLLLQCLAPIAMFAESPVNLRVKGGTAVEWSPPIPFLENVVWRCFKAMGATYELNLDRHGFYPKGGGEVTANFKPIEELLGLQVEHEPIESVYGISLCGRLPRHVAERQASSAKVILSEAGLRTSIEVMSLEGAETPLSPGSLICLWANSMYLGSDSLGKRGKLAEKVGSEAASSLVEQLKTGATVDFHTADHLILPISLSKHKSSFKTSKISLHTFTAIELAKLFTDTDFNVIGEEGGPRVIACSGNRSTY